MKLAMFATSGDFPKLKGRANEIRHLGEPLERVFAKFMDDTNREHKLVRLGLKFSVLMEHILDRNVHSWVFNDNDHREFLEACYNFLAAQTALGNYYHPKQIKLFHCTVKSHYLLHIALFSRHTNPRTVWTYLGEDYMQRIKKIVGASQRGTPPHIISEKVIWKYVTGLSFILQGENCWT